MKLLKEIIPKIILIYGQIFVDNEGHVADKYRIDKIRTIDHIYNNFILH